MGLMEKVIKDIMAQEDAACLTALESYAANLKFARDMLKTKKPNKNLKSGFYVLSPNSWKSLPFRPLPKLPIVKLEIESSKMVLFGRIKEFKFSNLNNWELIPLEEIIWHTPRSTSEEKWKILEVTKGWHDICFKGIQYFQTKRIQKSDWTLSYIDSWCTYYTHNGNKTKVIREK